MQRPTIKTIAQETGLSIATVSKALKQSPQVRPETRAIVLAAAERVGYELNMHGVQLRTGKTYQVAAIMTAPGPKQNEWEGVEYAQLLSGISWALDESPYRVSLYAVRNFEESLATIQQIVSLKKADGIIVSGTRADDPRVRIMQEAGFPFVTYGTTIHNAPHAYVDADNEQMIRHSVARLAERGHRRIALINPMAELTYAITRLDAYRRALETAGLAFEPALVAHGQLTPAFGRENVLAMSVLPIRRRPISAPTKPPRSVPSPVSTRGGWCTAATPSSMRRTTSTSANISPRRSPPISCRSTSRANCSAPISCAAWKASRPKRSRPSSCQS